MKEPTTVEYAAGAIIDTVEDRWPAGAATSRGLVNLLARAAARANLSAEAMKTPEGHDALAAIAATIRISEIAAPPSPVCSSAWVPGSDIEWLRMEWICAAKRAELYFTFKIDPESGFRSVGSHPIRDKGGARKWWERIL